MKRKLSLIGAAIMVLLIIYSGVAWWMLRGAGAYRIGTQLGEILSVSWQYTALTALFLVLILGIPFMLQRIRKSKAVKLPGVKKNLRRKGEKSGAETEIQVATQNQHTTEKIQPRRGTHVSSEEETVLLRDGIAADDETVLLHDSTVGFSDETVALHDNTVGSSDETVPLRDEVTSSSDDETVLLNGDDSIHDDTTILLTEELSAIEKDTALSQAGLIGSEKVQTNNASPADIHCCPKCGAPTRVGQKFCTHCGCVLRGGGV